MQIEVAGAAVARQMLPQLNDLLVMTVNNGASIGWLPPIDATVATPYWQSRYAAIEAGVCVLFLAWDGDSLAGTAQLSLEQRENGNHRAEVQKVMVQPAHRRRGIGKALMQAVETYARNNGRSLLYLDTRQGDPAEALYRQMGYVRAGSIANYVRNEHGGFDATVIYYKIVGE